MIGDSSDTSDSDLHIAVRYGDVKEVRQALECKLSPNKIGIYQWSPLHEAASNGHSDIVRLLLKHNGNPNLPDRLLANTALHYAAQEGHPTCLHLLIEAGGDYSLSNNDGDTAHDLATRACERIIEKKRVERLIRMPLGEAKSSAEQDFHRLESAHSVEASSEHPLSACTTTNSDGSEASHGTESDPVSSDNLPTHIRTKAWSPHVTRSDSDAMGVLHVSFEYNTKKDYLKIRLWKLTGLMLSSTHSSMISTLYVKSSFVPDGTRASKRRSEEVRVASLYTGSSSNVSAKSRSPPPMQQYVLDSGVDVLFQPVTFKFSKPLTYKPISDLMSSEHRAVLLQIAVKQKYTQRTYKIAELSLPLGVAVTKIVREAFPLRLCTQTKLPDNMMILPNVRNYLTTASDPNLRLRGTPLSPHKSVARPASDINLRDVVSMSSHSPSVSIDIPFDEEVETPNEHLSQLEIVKTLPESSEVTCAVPMPGAISEDSSEEEDRLKSVKVESASRGATNRPSLETAVRITVTDDDSDSAHMSTAAPNSTKLFKMLSRSSADEVILLESGQRISESGPTAGSPAGASVTHSNESYNILLKKHKLKPKLPRPQTSTKLPTAHGSHTTSHFLSSSPTASDVILSLGDLELEDIDQPTLVHKSRKRQTDEHIV